MFEAVRTVAEGVDELVRHAGEARTADDTARAMVAVERQLRRLLAVQSELIATAHATGAHLVDAHRSAKVMHRHHAQLSGGEAAARDRVARMGRDLPDVAAAYRAGRVGTDHVRRMARVWSNPRVRDQLGVCEAEFLVAAQGLEFPDFDLFCQEWEQRVDVDGAAPKAERDWNRRDIRVVREFDGTWDLRGGFTSLDGAETAEIIDRIVDALRLADIEEAKAAHGDQWRLHLPRTPGQLRYDAWMVLIRRGAEAAPETGSASVVTNIVIDQATFEETLARLVGAAPPEIDPTDLTRSCHTVDGVWVNPAEVVARALTDHVRRVVFDSAGTVVELGRRRRLFTGAAREASLFQALRCYWKGCWVAASKCQVDHVTAWRDDGRSDPGNGAPACGHHNRAKEQGFHAWRDASGEWRLRRPDGTEVADHRHWWREVDELDDGGDGWTEAA